MIRIITLAAAMLLTTTMAWAAPPPDKASPLAGFGSSNKEPIKIDANKLEVQQQANKAIYSGDVVAIQGKMTMRCVTLVVFFNKKEDGAPKAKQEQPPTPGSGGLKRIECHGPVTITQEKQTATSDQLVFENDVVTLLGNVVLSDGENVQAGDRMTFNTKTQVGRMEGGRVRGIFTPGGDSKPGKDAKPGKPPKT